jgi:hypothetical protein
MTDLYVRLPSQVKAWQFHGQPQDQWPEWVREIRVTTPMGQTPIGLGAGVLLVPTASGVTRNAQQGHWLVLEDGGVYTYKPEKFEEFFASADAEPATPVVEPQAAAPVVEKPAATRAKPEPAPTPAAEEAAAAPAEDA